MSRTTPDSGRLAAERMIDDATLLRRYATEQAEDAFAEFVRRHLPLVYSAAARRLGGDRHRAEDVAQVVFVSVARNAHALSKRTAMTGWLYTATRNAAIDAIRAEKRRQARETEAHLGYEDAATPEAAADWSRLRPALDAAMDELSRHEREAVLLRFFQARPFADIGSTLGLSEDAARKRVERALDRLRDVLGRRKITSTSAVLATLLATETISAVPANLVATITGAAMATGGAAVGTATFITITKLQGGIAAAVIVAGGVALVTQQQTITSLRDRALAAEQQHTRLRAENVSLLTARTDTEAALAKLRADTDVETARRSAAAATGTNSTNNANRSAGPTTARLQSGELATPATRKVANTPENDRKRAQLRRRYDRFLKQHSYTPEQGERLVEALLLQGEAWQDLQDSVVATGLRADARGVEALRTKLYEPSRRELNAVLGDNYAAFVAYDKLSGMVEGYIDPMIPAFSTAKVPLSWEQIDRLAEVLWTNRSAVRIKPTDLSLTTFMDWKAVVTQAGTILTPDQLKILQAQADRYRQTDRPR